MPAPRWGIAQSLQSHRPGAENVDKTVLYIVANRAPGPQPQHHREPLDILRPSLARRIEPWRVDDPTRLHARMPAADTCASLWPQIDEKGISGAILSNYSQSLSILLACGSSFAAITVDVHRYKFSSRSESLSVINAK